MPDLKKPGATASHSKGNKPKPFTNKPRKKEMSPALMIGIFVLVILLSVGILFLVFKKPFSKSSNSPQTKTVYVNAEKEKEKLEVKTYTDKEPVKTSQPKDYQKKSQSPNNQISKSKSGSIPPQYQNKFVSSAREWQPINPGLREATNRFKNLVYGGKPSTILDLNILENSSYYSAYSEKKRNPIWVGYRLDYFKGQNKLPRPGGFHPDFRTKARIDQKVYSKTGYDRGHMCPNSAIAARYGKKGQIETFLMSNICPQKPDLNRKVWERLERLEEGYANKFGGIWVITGPIFDQHVEILNHQVEIPDAFYKILIDEDKGKVRVLPFIVPQNVTGKEILNEFLTSVDEIEKQTGLDFFTPMDKEFQDKLESFVPPKTMWN